VKSRLLSSGIANEDNIIDAVAEEIGVDRSDVEEMDLHLSGKDASLDAPVSTGASMVEVIESQAHSVEEKLEEIEEAAERAARFETAMDALSERERKVIELRYLVEHPLQLNEIGSSLGITKQRVNQIEKRAVEKLKNLLIAA